MNHKSHRPVNPTAPLYTQFRAQRKHLGLTNQQLAELAGVERITVARALGPNPDTMSDELAVRLGAALGFDSAHVALVHTRDVAKDAEFCARKGGNFEDQELFRQTRQRLDAHLEWQKSQFVAKNSGHRLAFRAKRIEAGCTGDSIAKEAARRTGGSPLEHARLIRLYEASAISISESLLHCWLDQIVPSGRRDPNELDRLAAALRIVHPAWTTTDWRDYAGVHKGTSMQIYCPPTPGYEFHLGSTPTVYGPLDIQSIRTVQPGHGRAGLVRLVARPHDAFEIIIMLKGETWLTLSERPFPEEELGQSCQFEVGKEGIVHNALYAAGKNPIVCFPCIYYHHRAAFQGRECLMAVVNIRGNLHLGRRYKRP